jgi:hypothetical protein
MLAFSPRGEVTVGDEKGGITVWDLDNLDSPYPCKARYRASLDASTQRPVKALAWSPDGKVLLSSEEGDPFVCVYLYHDQAWTRGMLHNRVLPVACIAWRPDNLRIAIAHDTEIEIRARRSWRKVLLTCSGSYAHHVTQVGWSPDGKFVLSLGMCGELCVWNAKTGELVARIDESSVDDEERYACSFSILPAGQVLVGGRNWIARLFDVFDVVGYRITGRDTVELTGPVPWNVVYCSQCCTDDDRQEGETIEEIARIEAADLVCPRCGLFLTTGLPAPTGHPLKDFFAIDLLAMCKELDIDAWTLGGCWISSLGLLRWMQTSPLAEGDFAGQPPCLMTIEGIRPPSPIRILDHVVVAVTGEDGLRYCLDADGASLVEGFLREWHMVTGLCEPRLTPLNEQQLAEAGIPINPGLSDRIADALHEKFGPWQPSLLACFVRTGGGEDHG